MLDLYRDPSCVPVDRIKTNALRSGYIVYIKSEEKLKYAMHARLFRASYCRIVSR